MSGFLAWHTGGRSVGGVYRLRKEDLSRLGCVPMAGRMKEGDIVVATRHSGNFFWDYVLVRFFEGGNRSQWMVNEAVGKIAGYSMGQKIAQLEQVELETLLANSPIRADSAWEALLKLEAELAAQAAAQAEQIRLQKQREEAELLESCWAS